MKYRENHYVPRWYQERFLPSVGEKKFRYLDLSPEKFRDPKGIVRTKTALHRWGAVSCFKETDLYTTNFGRFESTDIEKFFFGRVDEQGRKAVEFFCKYNGFGDGDFDSSPEEAFHNLLNYLSIQRFRTPKGLKYLASIIKTEDKNALLLAMQRLQNLHCAIWTESIWCLVDANNTRTKFIVSDHPVTVYNRGVFPDSDYCRKFTDPDFRMNGTHTIFPLSPTRALIFTHVSWARNPYGKADKLRPNPTPFRTTMFNFLGIQTGRELDETEVNQINFVIKRRAHRFIAAAKEEWLYPEKSIPSTHWSLLDDRYFLMPDPRSLHYGGEIVVGFKDGSGTAFDAYGRRPWQKDYKKEGEVAGALDAFKGEYARLFGRIRRGTSSDFGGRERSEDNEDLHKHYLSLEEQFRPTGVRPRRDKRAR